MFFFLFSYLLEKAERRKKKNRKKKERKKEKRKAQQLKEGSSGKWHLLVFSFLSAKFSYVSNNVCSKGVMCMQLNPTISNS